MCTIGGFVGIYIAIYVYFYATHPNWRYKSLADTIHPRDLSAGFQIVPNANMA